MNKSELRPGDLVEVIDDIFEGFYERTFIGKIGLVLRNRSSDTGQDMWQVLIEEQILDFHTLDLKVLK